MHTLRLKRVVEQQVEHLCLDRAEVARAIDIRHLDEVDWPGIAELVGDQLADEQFAYVNGW